LAQFLLLLLLLLLLQGLAWLVEAVQVLLLRLQLARRHPGKLLHLRAAKAMLTALLPQLPAQGCAGLLLTPQGWAA
jgi:hypothetical protein